MKTINSLVMILSLSLLMQGCFKIDTDETPQSSPGSANQSYCAFTYSEEIYLSGSTTTDNFINEDTNVYYSITNNTCEGISNQSKSGRYVWVSRNGNTFTFAVDIANQSEHQLFDLTLTGSSFDSVTTSACNSNGEELTQTLTSSSINHSTKKINLVFYFSVRNTGCSSYTSSINYENTALKGIWKESCDNGKLTWMTFYQNAVAEMTYYYSNADCTGTKLMYIERNGTHKIGNTISDNMKEVNYSFHNFLVKVYDSTLRDDFISNSMCGYSYWPLGVDKDVSGKTCNFSILTSAADQIFTSTYTTEYDVFEISGPKLYLGDPASGNKTSTGNRPTSTDSSNPFTFDSSALVKPSWTL